MIYHEKDAALPSYETPESAWDAFWWGFLRYALKQDSRVLYTRRLPRLEEAQGRYRVYARLLVGS